MHHGLHEHACRRGGVRQICKTCKLKEHPILERINRFACGLLLRRERDGRYAQIGLPRSGVGECASAVFLQIWTSDGCYPLLRDCATWCAFLNAGGHSGMRGVMWR